jgi:NAD(P)H dehydrogenase (quinone)
MANAVAEGARAAGLSADVKRVPELVSEDVAKAHHFKTEQSGGLWLQGALIGKIGAVFTSTASQHGGQETTLYSLMSNLIHHGMVISGLPYSFQGQLKLDAVTGGSPYGATTIAAGDGSRQPDANELEGAKFLGQHVAGITKKLAA